CDRFGFDLAIIQRGALLPARLFHVHAADAGVAHALHRLLLKLDGKPGRRTLVWTSFAFIFRNPKTLAAALLPGKIASLGNCGAADMPVLFGVPFVAFG